MIAPLILLILGALQGAPLARAGLDIEGELRCPTAAQIGDRLGRLHPDLDARGWHLEIWAEVGPSGLGMRIRDPANALIGERHFVGLSSCDQLAEAVAATLAVWLGEVTAEPLPAPNYPTTPAERATVSEAQRSPNVAQRTGAISGAPARGWQLELGAGALGSIDGTGAGAPGAELSVRTGPSAAHWGLQANLEWAASRAVALGSASAIWQRVSLGGGACFILERGWSGLELEADLLAGVTVIRGSGLTAPHLDAALGPGFFVGTRFFVDPRPSWRGWFSAGVAWWPVRQQVGLFPATSSTPSALAPLPEIEVVLAAGGSWLDQLHSLAR